MGKEQTGDPLDLRMNIGFVLVDNNRIAFPMPEVATIVHVALAWLVMPETRSAER